MNHRGQLRSSKDHGRNMPTSDTRGAQDSASYLPFFQLRRTETPSSTQSRSTQAWRVSETWAPIRSTRFLKDLIRKVVYHGRLRPDPLVYRETVSQLRHGLPMSPFRRCILLARNDRRQVHQPAEERKSFPRQFLNIKKSRGIMHDNRRCIESQNGAGSRG